MDRSPLTEADVEELLHERSLDVGLEPPAVRWHDGDIESSAEPGGREVRLNRRIVEREDEARYVALHELAHIALGHTIPRRRRRASALYIVVLLGTVAAAFVVLALGFGMRAAAVGMWIFAFVAIPLAGGLVVRPQEVAADRWAAAQGGPLTPDLAAHFERQKTWKQRAGRAFLNSHPSDVRRAQIVRRSSAS